MSLRCRFDNVHTIREKIVYTSMLKLTPIKAYILIIFLLTRDCCQNLNCHVVYTIPESWNCPVKHDIWSLRLFEVPDSSPLNFVDWIGQVLFLKLIIFPLTLYSSTLTAVSCYKHTRLLIAMKWTNKSRENFVWVRKASCKQVK